MIIKTASIQFTSCKDALDQGQTTSGVYKLYVKDTVKKAYCDMDTNGGGWTVCLHKSRLKTLGDLHSIHLTLCSDVNA